MDGPLLVFGRTGQVARELAKLAPQFERPFEFAGRDRIDLMREDPRELIQMLQPAGVINAAAYTAVDKAEFERDLAFRLNAEAPGQLARACGELAIPFVHLSTDYVFGGGARGPYAETDPVRPLGVYGASKAAGEHRILETHAPAAVIRTSWVYSAFGSTARRPADSRLESTRLHAVLGWTPQPWPLSLARCMDEMDLESL